MSYNIFKHKIIVDGKEQELLEFGYERHEYNVIGNLLYRSVKPVNLEKEEIIIDVAI